MYQTLKAPINDVARILNETELSEIVAVSVYVDIMAHTAEPWAFVLYEIDEIEWEDDTDWEQQEFDYDNTLDSSEYDDYLDELERGDYDSDWLYDASGAER